MVARFPLAPMADGWSGAAPAARSGVMRPGGIRPEPGLKLDISAR
jgi:hypothetical protein